MKSFKKLVAEGYKISSNTKGAATSSMASEVGYKPNDYSAKSDDELSYIMKDASEAAKAMRDHDPKAEAKYLDQVNDASTEMYKRKKSTVKENTEEDEDAHLHHMYSAKDHESSLQDHAHAMMQGPQISLLDHMGVDDPQTPPHVYNNIKGHLQDAQEAIRKAHQAYHEAMVVHHKQQFDYHTGKMGKLNK